MRILPAPFQEVLVLKRFPMQILLVLALLAVAATSYAATIGSSAAKMTDLPYLVVTSAGPAGSTIVVAADTTGTGSSKKAMVHRWTINGTEVDVLIRVQNTSHGLYVDLVSDANITSLSTSTGSMSLTTASHPAPAKDATDTAALVAAGGS